MAFITDIIGSEIPFNIHPLGNDLNLITNVFFTEITGFTSAGITDTGIFLRIKQNLDGGKGCKQFLPGPLRLSGVTWDLDLLQLFLTCILCKHFRFIYDPRHKGKLIGILDKPAFFTGLTKEHTAEFFEVLT